MNLGDIFWVEFSGGAGRAQAGRRPAIIVQGLHVTDKVPTVLVVPLTTQQDALRFPGTLLVEPDGDNGLSRPSVALVFQLTAIDQRALEKRLGNTSQTTIQAIWTALDEMTCRGNGNQGS